MSHLNCRYQLKAPLTRGEGLYSRVVESMTSITGHTTILRSLEMAYSRGSSHTRFTSQWLSRNTRTSPGEARTGQCWSVRMKYLPTQIKVQNDQSVEHLLCVWVSRRFQFRRGRQETHTLFGTRNVGHCVLWIVQKSLVNAVKSGFREDSKEAGGTRAGLRLNVV